LGAIHSADVVLLLADDLRRHLRIRCVVRPDRSQSSLLDRLGRRLPERLRLPAVMPGNVVPTSRAKSLKRHDPTPRTAEVGLADVPWPDFDPAEALLGT
jgi:hypothetical protein